MDEIYETQPERTDLPLVVMPVIIESMIEPFEKNFELFKDIARVRMYRDFTLDEDTIVARCAEADAIMVVGFHCTVGRLVMPVLLIQLSMLAPQPMVYSNSIMLGR